MITNSITIGTTLIEWWHESQTVRITLPDGRQVHAVPENTDDYHKRATEYGYSTRWQFCLDHEIGHVLVSWLAFGVASPTLVGVADKHDGKKYHPNWWTEEEAVLGLQRFLKLNESSVYEMAAKGFA